MGVFKATTNCQIPPTSVSLLKFNKRSKKNFITLVTIKGAREIGGIFMSWVITLPIGALRLISFFRGL